MASVAKRRKASLAGFRRRAVRRMALLRRRYGDREARSIIEGADRRYTEFLGEIAALPKGMMNGALAATYEYLAYAKAMEALGYSEAEVGTFFHEAYSALVDRFPSWLGRLVFRVAGPLIKSRLKREARESMEPGAEGGWRFEFVEGGAGSTSFGFDVQSCAVCSTFERHGARDYVPYLCALDDKMSDAFGMGLRRSDTIARGSSCCDFRYEAGGPPRPLAQIANAEPKELQGETESEDSGSA